jgi:hypothetical protein
VGGRGRFRAKKHGPDEADSVTRVQRREKGAEADHPVLDLQRAAGNAAVARLAETESVQRSALGDLWDRAKEAVGAEEKPNAELTAEEMSEDLEGVIDKLEKAQKVAPGELKEALGGVADGLGKVKGPIDKMLKYQELARDLRKFHRALQKLNSLDLNRDYAVGADAMSDLAEVAGKLGGKALPEEVGAAGAYFAIIEHSGEIWKAGARVRAKKEAQLDPDKYQELLDAEQAATPKPSASEKVKLEDLGVWVVKAVDQGVAEMNDRTHPAVVESQVFYSPAFVAAYDEFTRLGQREGALPIYERNRLSSTYRGLELQKREPWEKGLEALVHLEQALGSKPNTTVSFQPALATWRAAKP